MKNKVFLVLIIFIFTILVGCATSPQSPTGAKEVSLSTVLKSLPERIEVPEYKVGDTWEWKFTRGRNAHSWSYKVVEVEEDGIVAVSGRGNNIFLDKQYNILKAISNKGGYDITSEFWMDRWMWFKEFPLYPNKKWGQKLPKGKFRTRGITFEQDYDIEYVVEGFEEVKVPAGNFLAVKILSVGTTEDETGRGKVTPKITLWYSPEVKNYVRGVWGNMHWVPAWQGVEFKLNKFELAK